MASASSGLYARSTSARDASDPSAQQMDRAISSIADAGQSIADSSRDAARSAQKVAGIFGNAIDKSLREQPVTTLLMAVAVGFLAGALWKS